MSSSLGNLNSLRGPTGSSNSLKGTGYKSVSLQQFTPQQMQLFERLFSNVSPESSLGKLAGGDQSQFSQLERPAIQQFAGVQSNMADRFSGAGLGNRRSSSFQNANTAANQNFAGQLQSQRLNLQQQAMRDLMGMSESLLNQRPYENRLMEKDPKKSFWDSILGGGLPILGAGIGGFFGGLPGAQMGGSIGGASGRSFM